MSDDCRKKATDSANAAPPFVPVRMLNEFVYCPRLFYLEWVQGEFEDNVFTVDGREQHRRVDRERIARRNRPDDLPFTLRSVALSSPRLGLSTRVDVLEGEGRGGEVSPIDFKRGSPPNVPHRAWEPERVQVCAQGLILRDNGYTCRRGYLYFTASKERVKVEFTDDLIERTLSYLQALRATCSGPIPPPLEDSPKCDGCSLHAICLPDEVRRLAALRQGADTAQAHERTPEVLERLRRIFPPRDDALPLYVQKSGMRIGRKGDTLEVRERDGTTVQSVRFLHTSQVCVLGNVTVTTPALRELLQREIPVLYYSYGGWFYGMATGLAHKNAELRIAQFRAAADRAASLALAQRFIRAKIRNCRTLLRRNHRGDVGSALRALERFAKDAERADSVERLLGIEGNAARVYFGAFSGMLRPKGEVGEVSWRMDFDGRNRRPPRDPVNALLSFAYALLVKDWTITLSAVGFDPFVGFYHRPRYGRPALALDLMEEFRPLVADSVVLRTVNEGIVGANDFVATAGGVALRESGRKRFLQAYERRMDRLVTHPAFGYRLSYRRVLLVQARLLARYLMREIPIFPVFETR